MLIEEIRKKAQELLRQEDIFIKGIWSVDCLFNPDNKERVFDFKFLVIKSAGQGSAYSIRKNYDPSYLKSFMGRNIREICFDDIAFEVAVYDSIFDKYQDKEYHAHYKLCGSSVEKAVARAQIICSECEDLLKGVKDPKIVNVGVVTNVIKLLRDKGYDVSGTDYDSEIVGTEIYKDVHVYSGDMTYDMVGKSDLAVVTGMTLTTDSADEILRIAAENGTKVVIFAETASNLGDFFIAAGADSFISEPFPFYIFDGDTNIFIKRKKI
jgi:hypothetical protein